MKALLLAAVVLSGVAPADHSDCAQLAQLKLDDVRITEAAAVPAGTGAITVAHCRVTGVIGAEIKFALLMPDYVKMFLMPGVLHRGGGSGPDNADWAAAIDGWVESGQAPARIVARKGAGGAVTRTRPLCPYPQHAVYSGTGSTDQAENFVCR